MKKEVISSLEKWYDSVNSPVARLRKTVEVIAKKVKDVPEWVVVLIAALISTRTKDDVTSDALKRLFEHLDYTFFNLDDMPLEEITQILKPVGFYRVKAKNLKKLVRTFSNEDVFSIKPDYDYLVSLSGVGRKVARIVLAFLGEGVLSVDTHVKRITERFAGREMKVEEIEEFWDNNPAINPMLVALGQLICTPRATNCSKCPISKWCTSSVTKLGR